MATKNINNESMNTVNNETKVVCPVCGTSFEILAHEQHVCGVAIAKDSGMGTVFLKPESRSGKRPMTVGERIAQLKARGIDTSNYFSAKNPKGEDVWMKFNGGVPVVVSDDEFAGLDEIEQGIYANGYVKNTKLFRRWIMAQMLRAEKCRGGLTEYMNRLGYNYSWEMVIEELRVQAKLEECDLAAFAERNQFFNRDVVIGMADWHIGEVNKYINQLKEHKCKGVPYKTIKGKNVFVSDIQYKVMTPMRRLAREISRAANAKQLYLATKEFYEGSIRLRYQTGQCREWKDAFKGAGAYYTLKNMIQFHGLTIDGKNMKQSLVLLDQKTKECRDNDEWWVLLGWMRELIKGKKFYFRKKK